jgi:predicted phosphodiesterase
MPKRFPKNLYLSDPHLPYTNMGYWQQAYEFNKKFKADAVYSSGDFLDQYTLSRFPRRVNSDNGHVEILKCIPQVKQITKWFPKMTIMRGNHDTRIDKRAQDAGISDLWIRDVLEMIGAPKGWNWAKEDWIKTGPAILTHGFLGNRSKHAHWFNENVVHGHLHAQLGIEFFQRNGKAIWVMCVGAMADRNAIALQYGPIRKYSTMTPGIGFSDENGNPGILHLKG